MSQVHGTWTKWWHGLSCGSALTQGALGAAGLRSSQAEAGEGEDDKAVPMRGSPGHDRR
jgi:hypothetical protein